MNNIVTRKLENASKYAGSTALSALSHVIRGTIISLAAFSLLTAFGDEPAEEPTNNVSSQVTISNVSAKQRYPWNGLIDIDYTIAGAASGDLKVVVEDLQNTNRYTATKFFSALPVEEGDHRITWSPAAEGVSIVSTNVVVELSIEKTQQQNEFDYCVIDISGGPTAENYPVTYKRFPKNKVWGDEFKTTNIVLRLIEAGEVSYTYVDKILRDVYGNETNRVEKTKTHRVDSPFFIGVFEVTDAQWKLVMSDDANPDATSKKPITNVRFYRGCDDFLEKLCDKTGITDFDLPEADEWEYACRAGTTSRYNNGGDSEEDLKLLGRYSENRTDGRGGGTTVTDVGSYAPNAWGLYDMHGNVAEWTLTKSTNQNHPEYRLICGGSHEGGAGDCTSSSRPHSDPFDGRAKNGFRIILRERKGEE